MAKLVRVAPLYKKQKQAPGWMQQRYQRNEADRQNEMRRIQLQLLTDPDIALDLFMRGRRP